MLERVHRQIVELRKSKVKKKNLLSTEAKVKKKEKKVAYRMYNIGFIGTSLENGNDKELYNP